jgi:predicted outer membrane repeat protein
MRNLIFTLIILLVFLTIDSNAQTIIRVKKGGTGDGSSWNAAMGDLTAALNKANFGDEVWTTRDTFKPTTCTTCDTVQRQVAFVIKNGVSLYGGFAGNEFSKITWNANDKEKTVLSGDINNDGNPNMNSYNVVRIKNYDATTKPTLINITIMNGNADNEKYALGESRNSGAAIYIDGSLKGYKCEPNIQYCRFTNNNATGDGGALYVYSGFEGKTKVILDDCYFNNNKVKQGGGHIAITAYFGGSDNSIIKKCRFDNGYAMDGAALKLNGAEKGNIKTTLNGNYFDHSTASNLGGAIYAFGKNGSINSTITDCSFINGKANVGGAIYIDVTKLGLSNNIYNNCDFTYNAALEGGALFCVTSDQGSYIDQFDKCIFSNNYTAQAGGAIFNNGIDGKCIPMYMNCKFFSNRATTYGGAVYNHGKNGESSPTFINCIFARNNAYSAGAVYSLGAEKGHARANFINCNIIMNTANTGGGVYYNASDVTGDANGTIVNSIIYYNSASLAPNIRNVLSNPKISYSLVQASSCNDLQQVNSPTIQCGSGMYYNANPLFKDTTNLDFNIAKNSLLVDHGLNDSLNKYNVKTDINNKNRFINGQCDIGAVEFEPNVAVINLAQNNIKVFPNPTKDYIYIQQLNESNNIKELLVYNINGQLIKKVFNFDSNMLNISELNQGMYFITLIQDNNETGCFKIVKE